MSIEEIIFLLICQRIEKICIVILEAANRSMHNFLQPLIAISDYSLQDDLYLYTLKC
jgi:hypothetical protein